MVISSFFNNTKWSGNPIRSTVLPKYRCRAQYFGIITTLMLAGCATDSHDAISQRGIPQPWTEITGAQTGRPLQGLPAQMNIPLGTGYIKLIRPAAMSASGNDIYLLDAGLHRIFRYDNFQQTLTPFATTLSVEAGMSLYAAPDLSVYVTDPTHERVLHFSWDGTPLQPLVSPGIMARPVSVVVDEHNGQVLVADGLFDRIIAFNSLGMTLSVFKPQQVLSIAAMATGRDGIYVVDRLAKRVVVLGWDGVFLHTFGEGMLNEPGAIAVTRDNIVFISDSFNDTVRIYREQRTKGKNLVLADRIGGSGVAPGSFNGIGGLAVVDDLLYVADSLNARVQIYLIDPRALNSRKIK